MDRQELLRKYPEIFRYGNLIRTYPAQDRYVMAAAIQNYITALDHFEDDRMLLHEFRNASNHNWATWVALVSPYGEEARSLERWEDDGCSVDPSTTRIPEGPVFSTKAEGVHALRECAYKVLVHCNPPQPDKSLPAAVGEQLLDSTKSLNPFTYLKRRDEALGRGKPPPDPPMAVCLDCGGKSFPGEKFCNHCHGKNLQNPD